jgi:hypothetical protein
MVMYHEMRKKIPLPRQLPLNFQSPEAKREAEERQSAAREVMIHEPVAEIVQDYLETRLSAEAVAAGDPDVDDFEGDADSPQSVRNYVTTTILRTELAGNPILQDIKMSKDKVLGQAMRSLEGWESLGQCRRLGKKGRWFCRAGMDNHQEFVPLEAIQEVDVDDLLS